MTTHDTETFSLACRFDHETENAILIYDYATEENIWIPLSQVLEIHRKEGEGTIVMTAWIARKKGLI